MQSEKITAEQAAEYYLERGWLVVEIPANRKGPTRKGWQKNHPTKSGLSELFRPGCNIGLVLGEPSKWLVVVDLDHPLAIELAAKYLPPTTVCGRESTPTSHWFYHCQIESKRFNGKRGEDGKQPRLLEILSTGTQCVVGPSVHPSGDRYNMLQGEPATVDAEHLMACVVALVNAVRARLGEPPVDGEPQQATKKASTSQRGEHSKADVIRRAIAYIEPMPPSISGAGGHNALFAVVRCLISGFLLSDDEAFEIVWNEFNPRCSPPWSACEIRHKIDQARKHPSTQGEGYLLDATVEDAESNKPHVDLSGIYSQAGEGEQIGEQAGQQVEPTKIRLGHIDPHTRRMVLSTNRTWPTAKAFIRKFGTQNKQRIIQSYCGQLWRWERGRYVLLEDGAVRKRLHHWQHGCLTPKANSKGEIVLVDFPANPKNVSAALDSIRNFCHLPETTPCPSWLDTQYNLPPHEIVAFPSKLLHLPTMRTFSATPSFFTTNALDFEFQPKAKQPMAWFDFLYQVFDGDQERCTLLQQWFGYCLVSDTSQQKILLPIGPKRSGKGTMAKVLTKLVGQSNVVGPTTHSLAENFGLQPLIGKSLAIVSDARFRGDKIATIVERLLCISGEDAVSIDRKFLPSVTLQLPTRFMFLTNELPQMTDASGALASRFEILRFEKSFYGNEDHNLAKKLFAELPGILNWSIEGWQKLREVGHFLTPSCSLSDKQEMEDLASPVGNFVRQSCVVGPDERVDCDALFDAYKTWSEDENNKATKNKQNFGRDLKAAFPHVKRREGSNRIFYYRGVSLK